MLPMSPVSNLLHRDCIGFELVQAIERLSITSTDAAQLFLNNRLGSARLARKAYDERRFEFVQVSVANTKRITMTRSSARNSIVDAAKSGRVLILSAPARPRSIRSIS